MRERITGAVSITPSRTMARPEPTCSPVSVAKAFEPSGVRLNPTIGCPVLPCSGRAPRRSRPVTVRRLSTA